MRSNDVWMDKVRVIASQTIEYRKSMAGAKYPTDVLDRVMSHISSMGQIHIHDAIGRLADIIDRQEIGPWPWSHMRGRASI